MVSKTKYRILMSSIDAFGHINCTLALGEILASYGHQITFAHHSYHKKLADKRNFKFIPFDAKLFENVRPASAVEWHDGHLHKFRVDALSIFKDWTPEDIENFGEIVNVFERNSLALEAIFKENANNFDLFIGDFVMRQPAFYRASFPCALIHSMNPLPLYPNGPPPWSGFSVKEKDTEKWDKFRELSGVALRAIRENLYSWWRFNGTPLPAVQDTRIENWFNAEPEQLGIYHYPELLDYHEIGPIRSDKWIRLDCAIREPDNVEPFIIPESLKHLPGKLIYFSLGSLGSIQIDLMKSFVKILSKSPHRFIVSKGPKGDQFELGPNMWGENYVNQIGILEVVDLVITHAVDCGIGSRINLYEIEEFKVLNTIEETLSNPSYAEKIAKISASMKALKNKENVVRKIENFIENNQK
uniref:UDP-glycosyltransferase n=1 Tax=Tetranychus urticae TaxID=32264 RepID=T1KQH4_TETUR